jgi:CysZ protein
MKPVAPLASKMNSFWFGLTLPWMSLKIILKSPKLILLSIIPVLITIVIYVYLFNSIEAFIQPKLIDALSHWGISPTHWFAKILNFLSKVVIFIIGAFTFSFAASIAACPFNDFLAEEAETFIHPRLPTLPNPSLLFRIKLVLIDLCKTFFAIFVSCVIFVFSFVPGVNFGCAILGFLMIAFQFLSYPHTRRGSGIRGDLAFLFDNFFVCLGFGMISTILLSIPLLSCFLFPVSVVGGTLLFGQTHSKGRSISSQEMRLN